MKRDIEWHEGCLKNVLRTLSEARDRILRMEKELERQERDAALYAAQIDLAKKEGRDGFDSAKYAIKRVCV